MHINAVNDRAISDGQGASCIGGLVSPFLATGINAMIGIGIKYAIFKSELTISIPIMAI